MEPKVEYTRLFMLQIFHYHYDEFILNVEEACNKYFFDDINFETTKMVAIEHFLNYEISEKSTKQMLEQCIQKCSDDELAINALEWEEYIIKIENKRFELVYKEENYYGRKR